MGYRVIKQPNGLYAIFSSISDQFTQMDCTIEEILVEMTMDSGHYQAVKSLERGTKDECRGEVPQPDGLNRWRDALSTIKAVHGRTATGRKDLEEVTRIGTTSPEKPVPPPGTGLWGLADIKWIHTPKEGEKVWMPVGESHWFHWRSPIDPKTVWSVMVHFRNHDFVTRMSTSWVGFLIQEPEQHLKEGLPMDLLDIQHNLVGQTQIQWVHTPESRAASDEVLRKIMTHETKSEP